MVKIACVLADDFEDIEFSDPKEALEQRGHHMVVVGSASGEVTGKNGTAVTVNIDVHAPSLLIEAGVVQGRTLTSWPSIRTDLRNVRAVVVDEPVVRDGNLVTSRKPNDLPAFNAEFLAAIRVDSSVTSRGS